MRRDPSHKKEALDVLRNYPRAIVHLRQQREFGRLGLLIGAGLSKDFHLPDWHELLVRLATTLHLDVTPHLNPDGESFRSNQLVAETLRSLHNAQIVKASQNQREHIVELMRAESAWRKLVQTALYQDHRTFLKSGSIEIGNHYLAVLLELVRSIPLTISYNFDDLVERALYQTKKTEQNRRGYTPLWRADIDLLPEGPVIYHPNGYLPLAPIDRQSDHLIFEEESFEDQMLASFGGHYQALTSYLAQNTCLLLGLSLKDPTLRLLLRQSAFLHPGHVHYMIEFFETEPPSISDDDLTVERIRFETYNIVTLRLDRAGIKSLLELLTYEGKDFESCHKRAGIQPVYRYYVTGPVGVGKSSSVDALRSLQQHEEWLSPRIEGMEYAPELLPPETRSETLERIARWLEEQFELKNDVVDSYKTGLHVLDRTPIDPLAFEPRSRWCSRSKELLNCYAPEGADSKVVDGHVFVLLGDSFEMFLRATRKGRLTLPGLLEDQQSLFKELFQVEENVTGITCIHTVGLSLREVVQRMVSVIFWPHSGYEPYDVHSRLAALSSPDNLFDLSGVS